MADNINVDPGTGVGAVPVATDDVSGVQYQVIKIATGGDGAAAVISSGNPLPVGGTVAATLSLDAGAGVVTGNTLRITPASNAGTLTVLQGAYNGGTWQIEGKVGGTGTLVPVTIDPAQLGSLVASSVPVVSGGHEIERVAPGQTDVTLGATGGTGDYIESILAVVETPATSHVWLSQGATPVAADSILPDAVGGGIGTYPIPLGYVSTSGAWRVTTGAGVRIIASGNFT